jgi:hypothetical protein
MKPAAALRILAKPGKAYRIRAKGRAFLDGFYVGRAKYKGASLFAGLESLDTPVASYPDTAVLGAVLALRIKDRVFGDVVESLVERVSWNARGLGEVASQQRVGVWVNGALFEDTGWVEQWIVAGQIGGVPLP